MQIIVLEDTKEYISYQPKQETRAQDRRPFDLMVSFHFVNEIIIFPSFVFLVLLRKKVVL